MNLLGEVAVEPGMECVKQQELRVLMIGIERVFFLGAGALPR